jgi:acyl-CoA synthetase
MQRSTIDLEGLRWPTEQERTAWYSAGWWSERTLADHVAGHAASNPDGVAYIADGEALTWAQYDARSTHLAVGLHTVGYRFGDRLGVLLPDGALVHTVYLAAEKAGVTVVGIGPRAGDHEIAHLLSLTGARGLVTLEQHQGQPTAALIGRLAGRGVALEHHLVLADGDAASPIEISVNDQAVTPAADVTSMRAIGAEDLFLLNSTSGTTGLPKCVTHQQNRWWYFHQLAVETGGLNGDDVFAGVIPAPFGFGLWTAHFTPGYLGVPTIVMPRFSASGLLDLIERHRVTVLCCVSTQFIMLLNEQVERQADLSSLRAMYTGGEAVPYERAAEFEMTTGAAVIQFYGSNETGALSATRVTDTRDTRLRTAGHVIADMQVRLLDDHGGDVQAAGHRGQPACKGPATSRGYYRDRGANDQLFTADGWMRTGDIAELDAEGRLSIVGRVSDFIIRGGKNISAVQIEEGIGSHPDVAMVAVVGMPDDVFGERVCAYVVPRPGASLTLDEIVAHLAGRGFGKELFPERLEVVAKLDTASGGKVAKQALRDDIKAKLASER